MTHVRQRSASLRAIRWVLCVVWALWWTLNLIAVRLLGRRAIWTDLSKRSDSRVAFILWAAPTIFSIERGNYDVLAAVLAIAAVRLLARERVWADPLAGLCMAAVLFAVGWIIGDAPLRARPGPAMRPGAA